MVDEKFEKPKPGLTAEVLAAVNRGRALRAAPPLVRGPGYRERLYDRERGDTTDGQR